jgi:hypothetical protein
MNGRPSPTAGAAQGGSAGPARAGIPLPLVRANQWTLVATVAAAAVARAPAILLLPWAITLAGLIGGPRWQPVFRVARRALSGRLADAPREDAVAQRFNAILAGTLLSLALATFYLVRVPALAWAFAGAVAAAAFVATRGFCIGCELYGFLPQSARRLLARGSEADPA